MQPRPRSGLRGYRAPGSRPKRRSRSLEPGCKMRRTGSFGRTPGRPNRPEPGTNTHTGQTRWQESAWSVKQDKINPAVKPLLLFLAKFNLTRLLCWKCWVPLPRVAFITFTLTSSMKSSNHLPASSSSTVPTQGAWKVALYAVSEMSTEWGLVIMKGTHTHCLHKQEHRWSDY